MAAQRAVNPVLTKEKATPRRGDFFLTEKAFLRVDAPQGAFFVPIFTLIYRLRHRRSAAIKTPQASSRPARMRRAQLRKNSSGRIRITGSVIGSNSQLSFPGKKMVWNTVNARSKSRAAKPPDDHEQSAQATGGPEPPGPRPPKAAPGHPLSPPRRVPGQQCRQGYRQQPDIQQKRAPARRQSGWLPPGKRAAPRRQNPAAGPGG